MGFHSLFSPCGYDSAIPPFPQDGKFSLEYTSHVTDNENDLKNALEDINATTDLLERALKLAGLLTSLFQKRGFPLVVVGGSAVEFYTEGGYMSGDIDLCRTSPKAIPLRVMQEVIAELGGRGVARSWKVCGLCVDMLGFLESETVLPCRELEKLRHEVANDK